MYKKFGQNNVDLLRDILWLLEAILFGAYTIIYSSQNLYDL